MGSARMPAYSELDVNGHVNNARYADWLCDALGIETMQEYRVKTMRLSYAAEIRPGQEMQLRLTRDGLAYHLTGTHEGKRPGGAVARPRIERPRGFCRGEGLRFGYHRAAGRLSLIHI